MSILKTLRTTSTYTQPYPYIDTPDFAYAGVTATQQPAGWLDELAAQGLPIGSVTGSPQVAVIGGGVSGLCAGYELTRAGCAVTVFEQSSEVGGRCASYIFPTGDIAEMGSMRFPPSEFILDHYLRTLQIVPGGIWSLPDFPDPGKQQTYVCYGADVQTWLGPSPPAGFETVSAGWGALIDNGLTTNGVQVLQSVPAIVALLQAGNVAAATTAWQAWLNAFGQTSFYSGLYQIFTGAGYDIPGGTAWQPQDFDKFGELGLGSGGFGPLYPIGFTEILRIVINGLETSQRFLQPTATLTQGIRTLAISLGAEIISAGGAVSMNAPIGGIGGASGSFMLTGPNGEGPYGPFARVIVATTTRAMELTLNLAAPPGTGPTLIAADVAIGIQRTHVVSSNKVAAMIPNFWANDPGAVRCLQTDNLVHQVYTLDYSQTPGGSSDTTGICFLSYVWDDDAIKQQALTSGAPFGPDSQALYDYLLQSLASIGGPVAAWVQNLQPVGGDPSNILFEEWQSTPYFAGAFKLSQPGQDGFVQTMFFDYQKCGTSLDTGVYIAGDCIHWNSGWVEGGLTTGLNAAAAVLHSLGGSLNGDSSGNTPLTISSTRYQYV